MTKNRKKFLAEKNQFFYQTTSYLSLGLQKGRQSYKKKPSALKREHPALQTHVISQKFSYLCGSLMPSRIRIPNTDPNSLTRLTHWDPDPQPCF
jgi:hypothetical protein